MYRLFNEYYVITCYIHFSSALHTFILFILEHIGTSTFRMQNITKYSIMMRQAYQIN